MSELNLPDGLTSRVLTMDDARAVYDVAAAQEQVDVGRVEIEPGTSSATGAGRAGTSPRTRRRLRRRPDGGVRRDHRARPGRRRGAPRLPPTRHRYGDRRLDAADRPGPRRPGLRQPGAAGLGRRPAAEPSWAIASAHTSWVLALPEGKQIEHRELPDGYADPRGRVGRVPRGPRRQGGRLPGVVGARPRVVRGLRGLDHGSPRLRAVADARRDRSRRSRSSASRR